MTRTFRSCILAAQCFLAVLAVQPSPTAAETAEAYSAEQIAPGVYVVAGVHALSDQQNAGHISNAGFIIGEKAIAVIDVGGGYQVGRRLLQAIRDKSSLPIRYVILTHDHPDHILGAAAFLGIGAEFVGHRNLPEAIVTHAPDYLRAARELIGPENFVGTQAVAPTILVETQLTLDLGGRPIRLEAWPVAHTNTDLTVMDEKTGSWFLGDLIFSGHIPALDGNLNGWLATLEKLKLRTADRIVPGHGPVSMPWPEAAASEEAYLRKLRDDVRAAIRSGATMQDAARTAGESERDKWLLFDEFNARNAISAYHELEWE